MFHATRRALLSKKRETEIVEESISESEGNVMPYPMSAARGKGSSNTGDEEIIEESVLEQPKQTPQEETEKPQTQESEESEDAK